MLDPSIAMSVWRNQVTAVLCGSQALALVCGNSSAVQSNAHREDKLSTSVCVPMLDGTLQEHCGEFPAWNKRANAIFFLAFIFMTAALFASIISVFLKCHQRLRREEYLTIGDNAISSSHPVLYRSSFHFQPPKNWMNGEESRSFVFYSNYLQCPRLQSECSAFITLHRMLN